ncbi:hypothetical protein AAMO2058_000108200 [Amorphochlora amoebiformis]
MESRPAHTCPVAIHVRWPRRLLWRALLVILTVYAGSIMELSQNLGLFASGSTTHPVITDFALMQLRGGRGSRLERESKGSESKSKRRKGSSVERSAYSRVMGNLEGLEKSMGNGEERLHNGRESRRHKRHGSDRHRQRKKNRDKDRKHRRHRRRHHRTSRRRRSSSETYSSTYSDDASGGPASGSKHQIKSIPTAAPTRFPTRAPTVEKITEADLVTKMSEFSRWLKESKKSLQDLTSYETRTHFERFVKMWNEGALSREVYGVPEEMNPNKVYNDEMEKLQLKAKEWAKRRQQYELRSNAGVNQPGGTTGPGLDPALAKLSRKERVKVMSMMAVDEISDVLVAMGPEEAASTAYLLEESQAIESVILMAENNPQAAGTLLPALEENLAEKILLKMDRALQNKVLAAKRGTYENLLLAKDSDFEEEYPELKHLSTEQIKAQLRDATKGYNPKDLPLTDAQREMAAEEKREIQRRKQIEAQRAAAEGLPPPGTREARLREKRRISRIHAAARREREDVIPESGGANIEDIEGGGDEDLLAELKMKQSRKANTPTSTRHESALQNAPPSAAANRLKQEREREARQDAYHEFQKREGEEKEKKIARMRERFSRDPLKAHAGEDEDGRERRLRMRKFFEDAQKKRDEEVSGKHMDDGNWREMIFNKDDHSDSIVPEYTDAVKRWEKRKLMDYSDLDEDMMQNTDILFNHPGQSDVELPDAEVHDSETEASGRAPPPDPDEYNHEIYQENELELQANFKGISKGFMEKPGAGFEPRNDDIQDEDNL